MEERRRRPSRTVQLDPDIDNAPSPPSRQRRLSRNIDSSSDPTPPLLRKDSVNPTPPSLRGESFMRSRKSFRRSITSSSFRNALAGAPAASTLADDPVYVAFLRATPLLQALSSRAGVVPYLLRSSHLATRKIGETIVRVNASTSHLPIVYSGEILLTSGAPGRFSLLRVGPGQCIPCAPPASSELPACVACCTARVTSETAEVLMLPTRALSSQLAPRALAEITAFLVAARQRLAATVESRTVQQAQLGALRRAALKEAKDIAAGRSPPSSPPPSPRPRPASASPAVGRTSGGVDGGVDVGGGDYGGEGERGREGRRFF